MCDAKGKVDISSKGQSKANKNAFNPWKINPEDREDMLKGEPDVPESSSTRCLHSSSLASILAWHSLVLRVLPVPNGWYQNYHDRLVHTVVLDPFLFPSGLVKDGNIAVTYVSRSTAEPPTGKGKDFIMICGDGIGTIHTTKKASRDMKTVTKDSNFITTMEGRIFLCANACLLGDRLVQLFITTPNLPKSQLLMGIFQSQFCSQMLLGTDNADCLPSLQSFEERTSSKQNAVDDDDLFDSSQPFIHKSHHLFLHTFCKPQW
ncbi:hypothetical protein BDR04DRAFT_1121807 [Suillus decipiens]|nr:hypothetical protein BDR04DRAFT_1121807 [Suillus decipiens]